MKLREKAKEARGFLEKNIFLPKRISFFFIVNAFLAALVLLLLFIRFRMLWLTAIFSFVIFFIRYERQKMMIPITFEPVILFSAVLTWAYGLSYGIFAASVPILLSDTLSARLRAGTFISILCKILVLVPVFYLGRFNMFWVTLLSYIIFNEGIGTFLALRAGSEMNEVLTQLATSTIIRIIYLQFFLGPLCLLTGAAC